MTGKGSNDGGRGADPGVEAMIAAVAGRPVAMARLARTLLLPRGDAVRAQALGAEALALDPGNGEIAAILREIRSADVGSWYFSMVRDHDRHATYRRALERALAHGGRVLDIGAGTGLFAMMAARAGADHVLACERNPAVADATRRIVARNGLSDRVTVLETSAEDLAVGVDLEAPVDVILWDNLANNLVGAGALPVLEDAVARLGRRGAAVIPAAVTVCAALAENLKWGEQRMDRIEGFDLSPFNDLAQPVQTLDCRTADLGLRGPPTELFHLDFRSGGPFPAARVETVAESTGGAVNGLVQWLRFDLDGVERYDTAPGSSAVAFGLQFHPFAQAIHARAGESFRIHAAHDRLKLRLWLAGERGP